MKEIIQFVNGDLEVSEEMIPAINELLIKNPDIVYALVDINLDPKSYEFYSAIKPIPSFPAFFGIVDGKVHDTHFGKPSAFMLESLVG